MTWIKLDDRSPRHPKVAGLSDKAFRVWVQGMCYASEFLTDGLLPVAFMRGVPSKIKTELVGSGLWRERGSAEVDIHDYLEHQSSRADIEKERDRNRRRRTGGVPAVQPDVDQRADAGTPEEKPRPENREQRTETESEEHAPAPKPRPYTHALLPKRDLGAFWEGPIFNIPDGWARRVLKASNGKAVGSDVVKFAQQLTAKLERDGGEVPVAGFLGWLDTEWAAYRQPAVSDGYRPAAEWIAQNRKDAEGACSSEEARAIMAESWAKMRGGARV